MEKNEELIVVTGTVSSIIFANEENGYTVLTIEDDNGELHTATGCLPFAACGEMLSLYGAWVRHPSHGQQFRADFAERTMPTGVDAIYEYLASGVIRGIGPATASILVSEFGESVLEVIEQSPERLTAIKGMSRRRAEEISESLRRQSSLRRLMEFLNVNGIKPQYAMRLYAIYGAQALENVRENPYILCMPGIGAEFSEADELALSMGMDGDSSHRIAAAIVFELEYNSRSGHVFIPREKLIPATAQLIGIEIDAVEAELDILVEAGEIMRKAAAGCDANYLPELFYAEEYVAGRILEMNGELPEQSVDITKITAEIEAEQNIEYAPLQRKTLELALRSQIMVLTGGPGTGKTTTVRALIALFEKLGIDVVLAAPTGRAAKRMTELSGREASTVHRLLEAGYSQEGSDLVFKRNEKDPLKCGAVILDECSMVDITIMQALLAALPRTARLVLVGDADQLPSVGPGNVFLDVLRSLAVPSIRLTEIFRQTKQSRIVSNAHLINSGSHPDLESNKGDFFFMRRLSPEVCARTIVSLCAERLPQNMNIKPEEIQVLTPAPGFGEQQGRFFLYAPALAGSLREDDCFALRRAASAKHEH